MQKNTGFTRVLKAAFYSYKGLTHALIHEAAFRQEAIGAAVLIPLAFWLDVGHIERLLLVISVVLVLIVELLNTGIEAVVDRIGLERHMLAGVAKDTGSAAVFLSLILCAFVWASILLAR
jgi:diacylglycerol kinase (ATP)